MRLDADIFFFVEQNPLQVCYVYIKAMAIKAMATLWNKATKDPTLMHLVHYGKYTPNIHKKPIYFTILLNDLFTQLTIF